MKLRRLALLIATLSITGSAHGFDDAALRKALGQRLQGDRTGACFAAAVIEKDQVSRALACADADGDAINKRRISADASFEIGSISKTMNAALLASLVAEGKLKLDDPLAKHLPPSSKPPKWQDQPILLRHLLTHSSGLPSIPPSWQFTDPANPYAKVSQDQLLGALTTIKLQAAPGSHFEYSNYAAMLLSWVVAKAAGQDYETLISERLFQPLAMRSAYIDTRPEKVQPVQGHIPNRQPSAAWTFPKNTAGVGGVRASLNDMIHYLQAQIGQRESSASAAIKATHEPLSSADGQRIAWGWMLAPLNGREFLVHEGGTGGFSAFAAFSRDGERAAVVLSDTALTSLGGLSSIGLHLLDPKVPVGPPRRETEPDAKLLDALVGRYRLQSGLNMELRRKGDALEIQAEGQPAFLMGYDSAGDFYPQAFDAVLRPIKRSDGSAVFNWLQGGGSTPARRVDKAPLSASAPLSDFAGRYPLMPGFELKVFVDGEQLKAQATGQGAFALDPAGADRFSADAYGIEIAFERDKDGAVAGLKLHQGGQALSGSKQ